jgi:FlaA1/EpsC-like NDP-sugar epimerase
MLTLVRRRNFWIMVAADFALAFITYYCAYLLRFDGTVPSQEVRAFLVTVGWIVPLKIILLFMFGLYRGMWRYTGVYDLIHIVEASVISSSIIILTMLLLRASHDLSEGIFIIDFMLTVTLLGGFRLGIRFAAEEFFTKHATSRTEVEETPQKRLLIIGAGHAGENLARELKHTKRLCYRIVGFIDDDPSKLKMTIHGIPVLGPVRELSRLTTEHEIDELIIAVPSASAGQMRRFVVFCKRTKLPFKTVPSMNEFIGSRSSVSVLRDVRYEDLLGRTPVNIETDQIGRYLTGRRVMVTGAAGSIGSELCRQIALFSPALLVLVDRNESGLYEIEMELRAGFPDMEVSVVLAPVQDRALMQKFFSRHRTQVVFHAAAYKHVPMMEFHPWEAIFNNVQATMVLLDLCIENGVEKCVIVSSDKAVRPSNVMGATKRLAELMTQAYARENHCQFMAVRFGNVIGSAGSVVPLFRKQIAHGGPVTVTHKDITRYFMTISEACRLILQAGAIGNGGETFVLKMGTPINIDNLARDMIVLSGLKPDEDIRIEYVGLRPGEKLYEELIADDEHIVPTRHEKVMVLASRKEVSVKNMASYVNELLQWANVFDGAAIKRYLHHVINEYSPYMENEEGYVKSAVSQDCVARETTDGEDGASGRLPRILILDDHKTTADSLAAYLTRVGYLASPAYSAKEGLERLRGKRYDIVITDAALPDMKSDQLLNAIGSYIGSKGVIFMAERLKGRTFSGTDQEVNLASLPDIDNYDQLEATIENVLELQTEKQ